MNLKLIHDTMYWGDVKLIKVYTQNSTANKAKKAKKLEVLCLQVFNICTIIFKD